jgi:V/A-type H+-transporting ATPase subunit D
VKALPTIKNKESALRLEVKKAKSLAKNLEKKLQQQIKGYENIVDLWGEFDASLIQIKDVNLSVKKIAGVRTPVLEGVDFSINKFSLFKNPSWFLDGITILKNLAEIA